MLTAVGRRSGLLGRNIERKREEEEGGRSRPCPVMATPATAAQVTNLYVLAFLALLAAVLYQVYSHLLADAAHDGLALLRSAASGSARQRPSARLLVGVASHLENVEERQAVRRTWKRLAREGEGEAEVLFFAGKRPCDVDEYWRLRRASCEQWSVFVPANANEDAPARPFRVQPSMVRASRAVDGLGFVVMLPIAISQLGVSRRALKMIADEERVAATAKNRAALQNLTVELVNAANSFVEVSANFSKYELDSLPSDDGFVYLPVATDVYSRHFEGVLRLRGTGGEARARLSGLSCNVIWHKTFGDDGLLRFTSALFNGTAQPFSQRACPLASMTYTVPDLHEIRQLIGARDTQNKCQLNKNKNLQPRLVEENEDHSDVVHVPELVDTPSNVPLAALGFLKLATAKYDFEFVALTTDRTFLAVDRLLTQLQSNAVPPERSWRSSFRRQVEVPRSGEWAERNYHSSHYPIMPADTGSVLSRDLAGYLARNAQFLSPFSTLSASLAVWLAPLAPEALEDGKWAQENGSGCTQATVAYGPVWDKDSMMQCWDNYQRCHTICKCS